MALFLGISFLCGCVSVVIRCSRSISLNVSSAEQTEEFYVDKNFSEVLDGLILVDLRKTDPTRLETYMGKEGARRFLEYHAATPSCSLGRKLSVPGTRRLSVSRQEHRIPRQEQGIPKAGKWKFTSLSPCLHIAFPITRVNQPLRIQILHDEETLMKLSRLALMVLEFSLLSGFSQFASAQPTPPQPHIKTVWIILMENHNWSQIKGNKDAPYINNALLPMASHAEQYFSPPRIYHSLPNYLWLEAGTNFGILDDHGPGVHRLTTTQHLVSLLQAANISWKAYEEDISGTVCPLGSVNEYVRRHDPFVYFTDVNNNLDPNSAECISHVRPFTELATDIANNNIARYNFITPNLCDDMHDRCHPTNDAIKQSDTWLSQHVPTILNSAAYQDGGAVFITWDEPAKRGEPIGMIVLSPFAKGGGFENSIHYTHGSTLRTFEEIFGVTPFLQDAATQTDLSDLFAVFP